MTESETPICDLIEELLSRDLSHGTLGQALKIARSVELSLMATNTRFRMSTVEKREKERVRKADYRDRKSRELSQNVPGTSSERYIDSNNKIQKGKKEEEIAARPAVPRDKSGTSRGTSLPETWAPSEDDFAYGAREGLTREQVARCGEDMRLWAFSNRNRAVARKSDWTMTFRGWLRREAPKLKRQNGGIGNATNRASGNLGATGIAETLRRARDERARDQTTFFNDAGDHIAGGRHRSP
jgi:hypothetical protein